MGHSSVRYLVGIEEQSVGFVSVHDDHQIQRGADESTHGEWKTLHSVVCTLTQTLLTWSAQWGPDSPVFAAGHPNAQLPYS